MKTKQIIDEVDVSWCEWIREIELDSEYICTCNSLNKTSSYCKDNPNCYYKQLKRVENQIVDLNKMVDTKEQECEELKQTLAEIKPTLELYASSKIGEEQLDGTYKITVKNSSVLGDTYITFDPRPAKQALQKINEYEAKQ